jgi:hypothetical protein
MTTLSGTWCAVEAALWMRILPVYSLMFGHICFAGRPELQCHHSRAEIRRRRRIVVTIAPFPGNA